MKRVIAILCALVLALAAAGQAGAIPLTDLLLRGQTLTVGDKLFDQWHFIGNGLMDSAGTVDLANIDVTGINDPLNPGLQFVTNGELEVADNNIIDLFFGYRVSVLPNSNLAIKDVSFSFLSGGWSGEGLTGGIEDVYDSAGGLLGSIELEASAENLVRGGAALFAPQKEIWVEKNILLYGFADGDYTVLNAFSQRFSQVPVGVPEPGMLALLALGGIALLGFKRG